MLAQVILTPTESKKLIAKAIARLDVVRRAAKEGMVVMLPSSSTYFIVEELTGAKPKTNYWVCGVATPKGMCVEMGMVLGGYTPESTTSDPGEFRAWWIIKNDKLSTGEKLSEFLDRMKPTDVFIKGVNALDPQGNVGVLVGDPLEGGGLGVILSAWRKKKFNLVSPVGLEKLIPTPISQATKEAKLAKYDYAMGMPTGLFPYPDGKTVTELDAVEILSGATAVPIAAGGLGGAEGAITLIIKGTNEQVKKAIEFIEQSKGAILPQLRLCNCNDCSVPHCKFPVGDKHWALA
ncbi:hypothetical protein ES708_15390 [subsurface metagenome]